jgi:hypothetical protein
MRKRAKAIMYLITTKYLLKLKLTIVLNRSALAESSLLLLEIISHISFKYINENDMYIPKCIKTNMLDNDTTCHNHSC